MIPSPEQQAIISHVSGSDPAGPATDTLVIAGPGSGKTGTLVASIAALVGNGVAAEKIVAISFTNNSAAELKVRLAKRAKSCGLPALHRVQVATFHAWVGQMQARRIAPWRHAPVSLKNASLAVALEPKNPGSTTHSFSKAELAAADRHMEGSESFDTMEARNFNKIGKPGSKIGAPGISERNLIGFNHLKQAVADLEPELAENQLGTFGTLMRSGADLAKDLEADEVDWLFIDEAQDINAPQAEFVAAVQATTRCRVFAIADDDQGIYKFRGASNAFLKDFGAKPTTTTFPLTKNFRSTKAIVEACVKWITPNWTELALPHKKLVSERDGLPVVVLTNASSAERGRHAKIIIEACKAKGMIHAFGEVAALGMSPVPGFNYELNDSKLPVHALAEQGLPQDVLEIFIGMLKSSRATGDWHHALWQEFLNDATAKQQADGDTVLGFPGLTDLYAALEVTRRLYPDYQPATVAGILEKLTCGVDKDGKATCKEKSPYYGSRPDPDYAGKKINYISFHSSKGMEFPVVWVTSAPHTFAVSERDKEEGQPNVLGELEEWAKRAGKALIATVTGEPAEPDPVELNKIAARMEKRRLLYVAMSRASDLLMISAPKECYAKQGDKKAAERNANANAYLDELETTLGKGGEIYIVADEKDARDFADNWVKATARNPHWQAPKRYRVESYTSLSGQMLPGETREIEIPKDREYPRPQSAAALLGDQFHRIMHLLCMEPALIAGVHCVGNVEDLCARVSTEPASPELLGLLEKYFWDKANQPYAILQSGNCRSEVPFSVVEETKSTPPEEILVKGYIDLIRFDDAGQPDLILDYKTGTRPVTGDTQDLAHAAQLVFYRNALASTYSIDDPATIRMVNYYVESQAWVERS